MRNKDLGFYDGVNRQKGKTSIHKNYIRENHENIKIDNSIRYINCSRGKKTDIKLKRKKNDV